MEREHIDNIQRHIKTHSERSVDDVSAVSVLKTFLRSNGRIIPAFSENDKWPNTDGTFEFVSNPAISRKPTQSFVVQIKGTQLDNEQDGVFKYQLQSLAFPAFIYNEVTLDPGILFVVLNSNQRNKERVFWKYISTDYLSSIDFSKDSKQINFTFEDEIKNTDESINNFCNKLEIISRRHSFVKKLENRSYTQNEVYKIIMARNQEIVECIEKVEFYDIKRDEISKKMLIYLDDMCKSTLLLNAIREGYENPTLRLAWEKALLRKETKYLCVFLKGLRYIGGRIPEDGQSERLMLKYYDFLWQIREFLHNCCRIEVLDNLEKFPLDVDQVDLDYYRLLAKGIELVGSGTRIRGTSRFYVQKISPFFIDKDRYYEITLQLSDIYATKYNRITIYSKEKIDTGYSVQIEYEDIMIKLWDMVTNIKVLSNWKVAVAPSCFNKIGKIMKKPITLNANYGEYQSLMEFLSRSGISLLELIDLSDEQFDKCLNDIYNSVNTSQFKEILIELHEKYTINSNVPGKHTLRYCLLHLNEDTLEKVMPNGYNAKELISPLYLSSKCYPFEKNPYIANLVGKNTTKVSTLSDILNVAGYQLYNLCYPYILLKNYTITKRELYFPIGEIASEEKIDDFNDKLDSKQVSNGNSILKLDGLVYIELFEKQTLWVLSKLLTCSTIGNKGQKELNKSYLKNLGEVIDDPLKHKALEEIFCDSQIALIYGAAGTGKTKLINYISNLMNRKRKLFLTKTHTTLQNLRRKIDNPGPDSDFISIDRFTKKVALSNYDVIFVDECSIIDNEIMLEFLMKISENTFIVLAGDIFQIESINFGNWFYYAKELIKSNGSNIELTNTWRTQDETLKSLWNEVREKSPLITEKLAMDGEFSLDISSKIFDKIEEDEVVLCLNYDGKFGLNNMNQYFQNANKQGAAIVWHEWTFKAGDPIIFNDSKRFNIIYNNLKGRIYHVEKTEDHIEFTVDVEIILTESDCRNEDIEFIDIVEGCTRIKFSVYDINELDEDNEMKKIQSVVPFQIAYAVSIHKAQGLEFDSVKIIIPSCNSEKVTHDIFYTAITRSRKQLKIFWSSETMQKIISSFTPEKSIMKSLDMLKSKL